MALSVIEYQYDGSETDYDIPFAMGYESQSDVSAYGITSSGSKVALVFDFIPDTRVGVTPGSLATLQAGDTVRFERVVSKTALPVDLTADGNLTRDNVQAAIRHAVYTAHEAFDAAEETRNLSLKGAYFIIPSDVSDLSNEVKAFNVTVSGFIRVTVSGTSNNEVTVFVTAGTIFYLAAKKVWATGTTAAGIVGLY